MTQTRGVRNNNPGNIDYNPANKWEGQIGIEKGVPKPRFAEFVDPESGIRALAKLLLTYFNKHKLKTVRGIINRWAPSVENNTSAYVNQVANFLNVGPDDPIDLTKRTTMTMIVVAIIKHENAGFAYPAGIVLEGVDRALDK